jgi:hypothetical protein
MKASTRKAVSRRALVGYTAEQSRILFDEVERRHRNFVELWRLCPDRHCRRRRQCLGAEFTCTGGRIMGRRTKRQDLRLVGDFLRAPPPGFETA